MALQNWKIHQNENLPIGNGKNTGTAKADLPKLLKTGLGDRKALRDVSNTTKPSIPAKSKGLTLRDVSSTRKPAAPTQSRGVNRNDSASRASEVKKASKCSFLTEDEIRKCNEWAKEGIELVHFTGNDLQKLRENDKEERIKRKAQKVLSSLHEWSNATSDLFHEKEALEVIDVVKMELMPEVSLPLVRKPLPISGDDSDDLLEMEVDQFPFLDSAIQLKLKEESCF